MNVYIKINTSEKFIELEEELDDNYVLGTTYQDYLDGKWVKLSEEQVQFRTEHPLASVEEVFNMSIKDIELSEEKYRKKIQINNVRLSKQTYKVNDKEFVDIVKVKSNLLFDCLINGSCTYNGIVCDYNTISYLYNDVKKYLENIDKVATTKMEAVDLAKDKEELSKVDIESDYPETVTVKLEAISDNINKHSTADIFNLYNSYITDTISVSNLSNTDALKYRLIHPHWESFINKKLAKDTRVQYNEQLWKVRQDINVVLEHQFPSLDTAALYERIDEEHTGTLEDPIPYAPPMEIFKDKYYIQNDITYKCTRDSEIALTHDLSALVGIYVEQV